MGILISESFLMQKERLSNRNSFTNENMSKLKIWLEINN